MLWIGCLIRSYHSSISSYSVHVRPELVSGTQKRSNTIDFIFTEIYIFGRTKPIYNRTWHIFHRTKFLKAFFPAGQNVRQKIFCAGHWQFLANFAGQMSGVRPYFEHW